MDDRRRARYVGRNTRWQPNGRSTDARGWSTNIWWRLTDGRRSLHSLRRRPIAWWWYPGWGSQGSPSLRRRSISWRGSSLWSTVVRRLLWWPGFRLRFELVESLFGGERDHRILSVHLLLRQDFHDLLHTRLAANGYTAESLALTVSAILVELNLDEVGNANALNRVLDVLVRCPPSKVPYVKLENFISSLM